MRRFLHGLLVGVLTLWIPIDSAVAGWWHHHRQAMPVVWGPAFPPPCGAAPPFPGWAGAIVIDDRPLGPPPPPVVFTAPPAEVIIDSWITTGPIEGAIVTEDGPCDPCRGATIADGGTVFEWTEGGIDAPHALEVIGTPTAADGNRGDDRGTVTARHAADAPASVPTVETTPEGPTALEIPGSTTATTSASPAAPPPAPVDPPAASVLEPWEPKTVQGDPTAETSTDEPVAETMEDAEAFERPELPADDDMPADEMTTDEASIDDDAADRQVEPRRRNLFDDATADSPEAFESPRDTDDSIPGDAFEAPEAEGDFGLPEPAPMEEDEGMPADDFDAAGGEPSTDDSGFEPAPEAPADDMPADEAAGFEREPGFEDAPMEEEAGNVEGGPSAEPEPAVEEAPAEADPFDTSVLHTPGQPSRSWRDDTGRHGTVGRLVEIHADRVRILKDSGRHTTVPLSRLSPADRAHVAGVGVALGTPAARAGETAGL